MAGSIIRVLVVDDYAPWRSFVSEALRNQPDLEVIGQVADGLEAVRRAQQLQPELILLDIGLPTLNGIEAARRILEVSPTSKILFVSENRSSDIVEGALSTGASGYVVKSDAARELLPAVKAVLESRRFISSGGAKHDSAARYTQDACDNKTEGGDSLAWDSAEGIFRVDMDDPMPVGLPEEEQIHRILHGSYIADANDDQARMYGLDSAQDLIGRRMAEMVVPDDSKNIELTRLFVRSGYRVLNRKSYEVDVRGNPKVFLNSMTGVIVDGKLIATLGNQYDVTEGESKIVR